MYLPAKADGQRSNRRTTIQAHWTESNRYALESRNRAPVVSSQWTKEAPTEPGWYWWRDEDQTPNVVDVIEDRFDYDLKVEQEPGMWRCISCLDHGEWWPDPIEPPSDVGGQ